VESLTITLTISRDQRGSLLSSARELITVKVNALAHAEAQLRRGLATRNDLERHRAELAEAEGVADALARMGPRADARNVTARRAMVDEIVVGALVVEAQQLADGVLALAETSDLEGTIARLAVVAGLLGTLARIRR
jgi:hypothetical protein